jgi:hypothetical protein
MRKETGAERSANNLESCLSDFIGREIKENGSLQEDSFVL